MLSINTTGINNWPRLALISLQADAERTPPLGLVYLATYLNKTLGMPKENIRIFDKNYHNLEKEVLDFNPDLIGIGAMSVYYQNAVKFASWIKTIKNIPVILGGVHISSIYSSMEKCFDVGVIGEGEETLGELVKLYQKKQKFDKKDLVKIKSLIYLEDSKVKSTPLREPINLDNLPLPDYSFVSSDYFKLTEVPSIGIVARKGWFILSRGCPYRCVFCSTARFWGKMRFHSPEYIARIIEDAINKYKINYVQILDDLFAVSPQRLREIKKEFEKRGLLEKIKGIECTARANLVTDDFCKALKEIKVKVVNFGFESGSDKILKYLKAGSVSVEMNKKAVLLCTKYGLKVYGSLMYGSPTEKIQDMKKTNDFIDFCIKNKATNIWSFVATPFPATPFWDIALQRGKVSNKMDFDILSHHNLSNPLLLDPEIPLDDFKEVFLDGKKKLRNLRMKLVINFLLKNPIKVVNMVAKEPKYYISRVIKQLFKQ